MTLLVVDDVSKTFRRADGSELRAVAGVSFDVGPGESVGLVGESGSGKSTVARLVLGLLKADRGRVMFEGDELARLGGAEMRQVRSRLQVVFQEPFESLNPAMKVSAIVEEPLIIHQRRLSRTERRSRASEALERVGLNDSFKDRYPSQLSGGQQQRIGIARAIVTGPSLIVLDEPISSLDLSAQAVILNLLATLQQDLNLSYLFISHDIAAVRHFCARVAVIYRGKLVEVGQAKALLDRPVHPYTRALLSAALSPDPTQQPQHFPLRDRQGPPPTHGCPLQGRCPIEVPELCSQPIPLVEAEAGRLVACVRADDPSAQALLH